MAASDVAIANLALSKFGEKRITSLTDNTPEARQINAIYSEVRDQLLDMHPWRFALVRANLALLTATPLYGYSYQFQLPADTIRVVSAENNVEFSIEGDKLLTNSTTIKITYIARITDPSKFPPRFVQAFAALLAVEIALAQTHSDTIRARLEKAFFVTLRKAQHADSQGRGTPQAVQSDLWIHSRR